MTKMSVDRLNELLAALPEGTVISFIGWVGVTQRLAARGIGGDGRAFINEGVGPNFTLPLTGEKLPFRIHVQSLSIEVT